VYSDRGAFVDTNPSPISKSDGSSFICANSRTLCVSVAMPLAESYVASLLGPDVGSIVRAFSDSDNVSVWVSVVVSDPESDGVA
jgi:hypothetical protein